jgi:glycosyltransferase involved in cell wall biosynthesis
VNSSWPNRSQSVVAADALPPQPPGKRLKVLHVITRFTDGAGGNTLLTAVGADQERYEVWIVGSAVGPLWERADAAGIRTVKLDEFPPTIAPAADVAVLLALIRLIRQEKFAVVHTHSSKAGFLGRIAAWLCRTPVIVHTLHGFSFHPHMGRGRRLAYLTMERAVRFMTDAFIAVAPEVAREAVQERLAPGERMSVVPSGVELDRIPMSTDAHIRHELDIPPDVPIVGTVGRQDFQKAPLDFVRMAARVSARHPNARFVMVGEGPLLADAQAESHRLQVAVDCVGFRADAARLAAGFDVFVISSLYEGLGRALTEALASARPVVATAVNGVVDLVVPGTTGLLSPPGDPEALATNVNWMLDHSEEARRMAAFGQERVRSLFAPNLMCRSIEAIYAQHLGLVQRTTAAGLRRGG